MRKVIKNYLQKLTDKIFVSTPKISSYAFNLRGDDLCYYKTFGEKNGDKNFYVIWRDEYGAGFFSNYTFVICHILLAKKKNFIPIIDFENFKTLYNEDQEINSSRNAWNYYFDSLNKYPLEEVYQSQNVFFCDGRFPRGFSYNLTEIDGAEVIAKKLNLNKNVKNFIDNSLAIDSSYLGVHFRGKEQNLAAGHSFGPTYKQIVTNSKMLLEKYNLSKIFVVTEDPKAIEALLKNFPNQVFFTDSFRVENGNAYNYLNSRLNHRYRLGLEILRDAYLLSQCGGILYSDSNVNEFARLINSNQYRFQCQILNGINSSNAIYSKIKYKILKHLPYKLGGLLNKVSIVDNK